MTLLPPLSRTAADAEAVARVVHAGQVDQAGRPYIEHVRRVVARTGSLIAQTGWSADPRERSETQQIAWLHDVLEDDERPFGAFTFSDLVDHDFSPSVCNGAEQLVRRVYRDIPTYREYIENLCEIAPLPVLLVKLADLEDNSDPERLAMLPPDKAASLTKRYDPAKAAIRDAIRERFGGESNERRPEPGEWQ